MRTRQRQPRTILVLLLMAVVILTASKPFNHAFVGAKVAQPPAQPFYTITNLGTLGGNLSTAYGLNNRGQVVGSSAIANSTTQHAFLWQNGSMIDLGVLPGFAFQSLAQQINEAGQIVGYSLASPSSHHAFLWQNGQLMDLGALQGLPNSSASSISDDGLIAGNSFAASATNGRAVTWQNGAINDLGAQGFILFAGRFGQMAGTALNATGQQRAFLSQAGVKTELGTLPNYPNSYTHDVNIFSHVVGTSFTQFSDVFTGHAFLWRNNVMTDLGTLGGIFSFALSINDGNQIVGKATTLNSAQHAFIWQQGVMRDLNDLIPAGTGWELSTADSINNKGQIVGTGNIGGQVRAFLLTPIRALLAGNANAAPGSTVTVPIDLLSSGDENALGFSLTYDPAILSNPQAALGADAAGATLNLNTSQTAQGRVAIAVALPAKQAFVAGTRRVVNVSFTIAANAPAVTTPINFGDQPIVREVADAAAVILPTSYTPGSVTVSPGYEADLTPRSTGNNNGTVTIADWVQAGRFAAGIDKAAVGNEFQRADCAPAETKGNGQLSLADWVQAGRYAAGLDAVVAAGGPTAPTAALALAGSATPNSALRTPQSRTVRLSNANLAAGQAGALALEFEAQGDENALGFSLNFDAAKLRFVSATLGSGAAGAALNLNTNDAANGRVGLVLALPAGQTFAVGLRQLLTVTLMPATNAGGTMTVTLGDAPVSREVVNAAAQGLTANWQAATVTVARAIANVSAASFSAEALASEAIAAAFGNELATATQAAVTLPLPTTLAGTTVRVTDSVGVERLAPLFFVSPNQVNYLIPFGTMMGEATVTVTNGTGVLASGRLRIAAVAPAIFAANANGQGLAAAVALRVRADGSQSYEPVGRYDAAQNRMVAVPIDLGGPTERVYLLLFGSGWRYRSALTNVTATLGGAQVEVSYAGAQGDRAGLDQLNGLIPRSLSGRGEVQLMMSADGLTANVVTLNVK